MSSADAMRELIASIVAETIDQLAPYLSTAGDTRLSLEDAAQLACVRPRVLRDAGRRGELALERAGRRVVVRRAALEAWLSYRAVQPVAKSSAPAEDPRAEARSCVAAAAARAARSA